MRKALVVGINRYPFIKNLERPASDAEAIAHLLETHGGFQVRRLPAGIVDDGLKVNPKPGDGEENANITILEEEINKLFAIGETDCPDTALLFFAGHGLRKPRGLKEGFLATSEACPRKEVYGFALNSLRDILLESEVKQQVIWLDCCHSGQFIDVLDKADPRNAGKVRDRCFIAACSASETAYGTGEHGVLTSILLQGLEPEQCEVNEWINNHSLVAFVTKKLKTNEFWRSFPQRSVYSNSGGEIQLIQGGKSKQNLVENSLVNQPGFSNINIGTARERLRSSGVDDKIPGTTWLPIICQNLAVMPLSWPGNKKKLMLKIFLAVGIACLAILLVVPQFRKVLYLILFPITSSEIANRFERYQNPSYGFKIKYPSNWDLQKIENPTTKEVVEFFPVNEIDAKILSQVKVIIRVESLTKNMSLDEYMKSSENEIRQFLLEEKIIESSEITLARQQAYKLVYSGRNQQKNILLQKMEVVTLYKGKAYVITYEAEIAKYPDFLKIVREMIRSFEIIESE